MARVAVLHEGGTTHDQSTVITTVLSTYVSHQATSCGAGYDNGSGITSAR